MILLCISENFVHGSSTARGIDDTAKRQCEDMVFPDAVLKEFGYMRGKWCRCALPSKRRGE